MEKIKRFVEFKSIFSSKDVLKENESHANVVVATTMLNLFLVCIITLMLVLFNVFKLGTTIMVPIIITTFILLATPALICFKVKGNNKNLRVFLFTCFILAMAVCDAILKYNITLLMVLPIILAARYYNKKFTIWVSGFTFIAFILSTWLSVYYGQQDLNTYNLIIPQGTTITINSTLREAVTSLDINEAERIRNIYLHFFLPKIFVFSIISFACIQISQSGRNMIKKQIEISEKNSRIDTELDLAYKIQYGMLPSTFPAFPDHREIDIYAMSIPAKEVGGDFYDMFLVDDSHLAICIADVSGKGVPSALFMMVSKILIKVITDEGGKVNEVITRVNNILSNGNKLGLFVTAWFGVLDLETGNIEFVNAGHNPPLIYSSETGTFEFLKTKANFVIAGMENIQYERNEYKLNPGDKLFLYTDGVTDTSNERKEAYGELRLKRFLDKNSNYNVTDTIMKLNEDLTKFANKTAQFDDITMLELQYFGNSNNTENVWKEFKAEINELPNVRDFINYELKKRNVDEKNSSIINLAVEEIFVNIVNYAYTNESGNCFIIVNSTGNCLEITFEDGGKQFNPLEKEMPDVTLPKEKRNIGGLGIYLVQKTMDKVEYKYEDNRNILKIIKIIK